MEEKKYFQVVLSRTVHQLSRPIVIKAENEREASRIAVLDDIVSLRKRMSKPKSIRFMRLKNRRPKTRRKSNSRSGSPRASLVTMRSSVWPKPS